MDQRGKTNLWNIAGGCLILLSLLAFSTAAARGDWLDGWAFRREMVVHNPGGALLDYPVKVTFDNGDTSKPDFEFGHAASHGDDVRITGSSGITELHFWIEDWNDSLEVGNIWAKIPTLPESSQTTLFLYYGNSQAQSRSNGDSTFLFYDGFEKFGPYMNAPDPLIIPTYDGSGQAVHPDVVYFPQAWGSPNAYQYWMVMTPYPSENDDYENPSILASHNGIDWEIPAGLTNPLQPEPANGHNADADLLFADGQLHAYYCWYSYGEGGDDSSHVITLSSSDGVNWLDTTHLFKEPNYIVSPTLLYEDSTYFIWYGLTPACTADTSTFHRRTSADGLSWGPRENVDLSVEGWVMWHSDIQRNDSTYEMVIAAYPEGSSCSHTRLLWAQSPDGLAWSVEPVPILRPVGSGWDSDLIYRSCFLVEDDLYRIWYSAREGGYTWHVGYTQGTMDQFLNQGLLKWDQTSGDISVTADHARSGSLGLKMKGGIVAPDITKQISGQIEFSGWLYDELEMTPEHEIAITISDGELPPNTIGVGVYTGSPTVPYTNYTYVYHAGEPWIYTETDIPRTEGWHKLSINVFPDSSELFIDNVRVGSLDVLEESNIAEIALGGYLEGNGWIDDVSVRNFATPEPLLSIGEEQWPFPVEDLRATCSGADGIHLVWSPVPGAAVYRIYRSLNDPLSLPDTALATVPGTVWVDSTVVVGDPGQNYYYTVRGWNGSILSESSAAVGIFDKLLINETEAP